MRTDFKNVNIDGILSVIPSNHSFFEDELENYSFTLEQSKKLGKTFGYFKHNVVGNRGTTVSDLATFGIKSLLDSDYIVKSDIDAVVLVTQSPDFFIPATTSIINKEIGFNESTEFYDLNQGCNGFIVGLKQASMLLASGMNNVMLICGDVLSKRVSPNDRNSYPLSGDACSIILLSNKYSKSDLSIEIANNGSEALAINIPDGGFRNMYSIESEKRYTDRSGNTRSNADLVMQGDVIFNFVMQNIPGFVERFLSNRNIENSDVDFVFAHQPNRFMLERLRKKLGFPSDKLPLDIVSRFGNSSSATIPLTVNLYFKNLDYGQRVLFLGFGVGLSWGAAIMVIQELKFNKIIYYEE